MDIDVFLPHELPAVMRALRTALRPSGPLDANERVFLDTYARITGNTLLPTDPQPIAPDAVVIGGAHPRKRLLQLAALAVLLSRPVRAESFAYLKVLAAQLDTHDPVIDVIDALLRGKRRIVRLLAMRRGLRVMFKEAWIAEGAWGALRLFGAMAFRAAVNKDQLWNYKRLGLLPDGTLGREYWKHMTEVGFGFPGDVAGIAASVAYHDIAHVLAGHDITPLGEIQQGSFQGGNRREDGFFFVQFVVLHFHQGVKITPGAPPAVGQFDPAKVLWAIHRGAQCTVDMTHQWNYWPLMPLPIDEARERVGLLPKLPMLA
jgi:hypothetical protein